MKGSVWHQRLYIIFSGELVKAAVFSFARKLGNMSISRNNICMYVDENEKLCEIIPGTCAGAYAGKFNWGKYVYDEQFLDKRPINNSVAGGYGELLMVLILMLSLLMGLVIMVLVLVLFVLMG